MLGSSWPAIQAYILGVSESCFIKVVMPWPPSVGIRVKEIGGEGGGEPEKHGLGYWGKNCHPKTYFLNKPTKVYLIDYYI